MQNRDAVDSSAKEIRVFCGRVRFDLSLIQFQGVFDKRRFRNTHASLYSYSAKEQAADATCGMVRPSACVKEKANMHFRSSCSRSCRSWKTNKVFVNRLQGDRSAALHSIVKPLLGPLSFTVSATTAFGLYRELQQSVCIGLVDLLTLGVSV